MSNEGSNPTRRKFGALSLAGASAFVLSWLTGCEKYKVQEIEIEVDTSDPNNYRVKPISKTVDADTVKIRFVSATKGWFFWYKEDNKPSNSVPIRKGPRVWLDTDDTAKIGLSEVSPNGLMVETFKVPKKGTKLNVYFAMTKTPPGIGPRTDGDCGGGGEIDAH